jgi:hypothetical protein
MRNYFEVTALRCSHDPGSHHWYTFEPRLITFQIAFFCFYLRIWCTISPSHESTTSPGPTPGTTSFGIHLAISGFRAGYFGRVVESGSHQSSLRLVLEHAIDAAAIDSTVLEMEFKKDPSIVEQIRTITTLGRSPAPPWVVHGSVSNELLRALRREFMSMDKYIHEVSKFWKTPGCFGSPGFWITSIMRFVKWRELPQAWNGHEDSPGDLRKVQNCGKSFKVLLVVQSRSLKSLRGKVPRDGIEPPTPAFSGRHGGFSLATDRDGFIAYHLIGKYLRRNREHSYTD